jgi:hypothetical protein
MNIALITCFANESWEVYSKEMIKSVVSYWPSDIQFLINLNNNLLAEEVSKLLRKNDGFCCELSKDHLDFINNNKEKDHPTDYRKQVVRFCHKVFTLKNALEAIDRAKKDNFPNIPKYLIWMDADVITNKKVTLEMIKKCLPVEGDSVAYLGRKDWDHSECGWLAFDLENGGCDVINEVYNLYVTGKVFEEPQWHDSWLWDKVIKTKKATNLTLGLDGMDIWPTSPMGDWSVHHKGQLAKSNLLKNDQKQFNQQSNIKIQTKNSLPDEKIRSNISKNQSLIKNWVSTCKKTEEEIVVVSAGPMMIAENVLEEVKKGKKIVAVKHALKPLKDAGIKPWACILLDPRPRVNAFVENPDTDIIWFVASQVDPEATMTLLAAGCEVWGYHAAVGAHEEDLTALQEQSIVIGGSATATRGLFLLNKLGFNDFRLYGYDLCLPDKPNMNEIDELGQPKYFEIAIHVQHPCYNAKRAFWSTAELLAQYQEMGEIIEKTGFKITALGHGMIPFMTEAKNVSNLRMQKKSSKIKVKPLTYEELLCNKKTKYWEQLHNSLLKTLLKLKKVRSFLIQ